MAVAQELVTLFFVLSSSFPVAPLDEEEEESYDAGQGMLLGPHQRPIRLFCFGNNREAHICPMSRHTFL